MKRKASIWISAAIYFGLGIAVLAIILTAGTPVINKLRDKNIVIQTKEVMFRVDSNIREVARGGPGTQRVIHVEIKKGDFKILDNEEKIEWKYQTKALLSEPMPLNIDEESREQYDIDEGSLKVRTEATSVKGLYDIKLWLDYSELNLDIDSEVITTKGGTDLIITNTGASEEQPNMLRLFIKEK